MRPAVLSYSENHEKVYPLTGSKTAAGLTINYRMQIKSGLLAEKTMHCVSNSGYATIVKENQILKRERKYSLYYGEKILLIFNNGGTEIELHYKNMKPSER